MHASLETVLAQNNSANDQQIKELQDPTEAQDAVTKAYIDALIANLQSQIDNLDSTTVTDIDGNTYDYLTYGDQDWTVENAEMVTYRVARLFHKLQTKQNGQTSP